MFLKTFSLATLRQTGLAICLGSGILAPVHSQAPQLAMLDRLDRGQWELRFRPGNRTERFCIGNGRELIQIRHRGADCSRFVVEDTADRVTVQYTCRGKGYGRTTVRWESNALAQIQSQGLIEGLPFDFSGEARRMGPCPSE